MQQEDWAEVARLRVREFPLRAFFSVGIAAAIYFDSANIWPIIWLATTLLAQLGSSWICAPMRKSGQTTSPRRKQLFILSIVLSTTIFASVAPLAWFMGGWQGRVLAVTVLAGGVMNVRLHANTSAVMLWSATAPFMLLLVGLPLASLLLEPGKRAAAFVCLASLMYVAHLVAATRRGLADARSVAKSVADLVEALEKSARAEERLNLALEVADVHVWELDYVRRELFTAGAGDTFFERPLTYSDMSRDIYVTVDPRDRAAVQEAWRGHVDEGRPYRPQYRVARTDGRDVWVEGAIRFLTDGEGRPQRMVGAIQNITARKADERAIVAAKEEAEASNRAKSTFLATMSHEIRTPLNGVLGMAQAMDADELSPAQRDRLTVVRQSGETLLAILNDVLDLSKIEAAKLELEAAEFEINDLARGAYAAFTAIANKKGLSFNLTIEPRAQGVYVGDSTRVRQILYNLVSNAVKFTDRGEVSVRVDRIDQDLEVSVVDSGIGIAAGPLSRLFSKFEQADATTTRRYGGTGLGLAICRELATLMGGAIRAESQEGRGSTFTVTLPLPRVAASRPQLPVLPPAPVPSAAGARELKVLAAEDNEINRLVLQTLLQQVGVSPTLVEDGAAAVAAWSAEHWDIILMDVQMPNMDGPTACRMIRGIEAKSGRPRTPIIALTANAMTHQVADYRAAGMEGFVPKPIEVGVLFAAMEAALAADTVSAPCVVASECGHG